MTESISNYESFRECLSTLIIQQLAPVQSKAARKKRIGRHQKRRKSSTGISGSVSSGGATDGAVDSLSEDLAEFIEYLAEEIFGSLPSSLRTLTYSDVRNDDALAAQYTAPLPQSTIETVAIGLPPASLDSLETYGLVQAGEAGELEQSFLQPLLDSYSAAVTMPPASLGPEYGSRRTACEICERDWIPLTYHHLIPRAVHDKVVKRGWHEAWRLHSVAWLCRACHSMVHRLASNEELARELFSVELLLEREDVRNFAQWVGGVRWKKR